MKDLLSVFFFFTLFFNTSFCDQVGCAVRTADAAEATSKKKVKKAESDDRGLAVTEKYRDSRKRVALVIGNSNYRSSPLRNPANDAHVMASTLRRLGFEVEEKTNLGYIEMNKTVESFGKKLKSGGVGLFYYAGHGMQVDGANYLIPVDAQIEDENEIRFKSVDAGLILAKMEQSKSDINIVVLDACRDNPFTRSSRSASRGLAFMDAPSGTFIAYATAPGKTAADGDGKNGLYTSELVKVLESPGIPLEQVFKRANKAVLDRSGKKQSPWVASNLVGEFYFTQPSNMTDLQPSSMRPQSLAPAPTTTPNSTVSSTEKTAGSSHSYKGRKVTLEFADAEVKKIFQLLSEVSNKNFVLGDGVSGAISLKLANVPWDQALDIILDTMGFQKVEDGNTILIKNKIDTVLDQKNFNQLSHSGDSTSTLTKLLKVIVSDDATGIEITTSRPMTYTSYKTANPLMAVIDFSQAVPGNIDSLINVNRGVIKQISTTRYDTEAGILTRMAIELTEDVDFTIVPDNNDSSKLMASFKSNAAPLSKMNAGMVPSRQHEERMLTNILAKDGSIFLSVNGGDFDYKVFRLNKPERLIVDLLDVKNGLASRLININSYGVASVRIGKYPDKTRLAFDSINGILPELTTEKTTGGIKIFIQ